MLDKLPDEILFYIFSFIVDNVKQLVQLSQVSKKYQGVVNNPKLWYLAFQRMYPVWSNQVNYAFESYCLIDWKGFVIHLIKQQKSTQGLSFEFVKEQLDEYTVNKRKRNRIEPEEEYQTELNEKPYWIQDPLVVDIDRITHTGRVATGKHRKQIGGYHARSEHKILFWNYPSWQLVREFEFNLEPANFTCQIMSMQSIQMGNESIRFFSLAVGMTLMNELEGEEEEEHEDRADIWKSLFVYRLFDDGATQCMAHIKVDGLFLGREVFLFSDASWNCLNEPPHSVNHRSDLKDWIEIVLPEEKDFDPNYTVFVAAIGPLYHQITGCVQLSKFDLRDQHVLDPSTTPVIWDNRLNQFVSLMYSCSFLLRYTKKLRSYKPIPLPPRSDPPKEILTSIQLGHNVSCMIHFKYPNHLNHLICTGSSHDDELSVYDWRFGLKVGSLPWKTIDKSKPDQDHITFLSSLQDQSLIDMPFNISLHPEEDETVVDVRPWGLESTFVLPPSKDNLNQCGFRLIAVGDNRVENTKDQLEIKVWDISYLLKVKYDPIRSTQQEMEIPDHLNHYLASRFSWWPRRTHGLTTLALQMIQPHSDIFHKTLFQPLNNSYPLIHLPYSPTTSPSIILSHTFDRQDSTIPVKYTAYNVLHTSLFLLTEDGKVTVMDIETGKITGTVDNYLNHGQVKGIDVNVIGGKEVVVTSKEGLLRGVVL